MRRVAKIFMSALMPLLVSIPAYSTSSYSVSMDGNALRSGTAAVAVDTSYSYTTGFGSWAYDASLDARPGGVLVVTTADVVASGGYAVGGGISGSASASTNDFVITGPPGLTSVTGTFYFWLHGVVERSGGGPGNGAHQGGLQFNLGAGGSGWLGQWVSSNYSIVGGYGLAGYAGPGVGTVIGLTGDFPVGSGFLVSLEVIAWNYPYGNDTSSPMHILCNASESPVGSTTVAIGNLTGLVMDLPAGYTVSSPEWNVVDNRFLAPVLDAPRVPAAATPGLALLSPNPNAGTSRLRFTLATPGPAHVIVYDTSGRAVRTLADGWMAAGDHQAEWDGTLADGRSAAPGVYFASLRAGERTSTVRLVRVR